jgi:pyruvate/2-oxoglutarate dehydrogenase complex dihydrolipoamide dehydrogenase (E3) component
MRRLVPRPGRHRRVSASGGSASPCCQRAPGLQGAARTTAYALAAPVSVDLAAVRERKGAMVAGARQSYASHLPQDGLDVIEGEAHFTGPQTV